MKKIFIFSSFLLFSVHLHAQTINYNYDSLGRLTQVTYPDSNILKYTYDATGNRVSNRIIQSPIIRACPQSNISFFAGSNDNTKNYQWQVDTANGFHNVIPGSIYSGVDSSTLTLNNPLSNLYNNKYRCLISYLADTTFSRVFTLKFVVTWTGVSDTAWENPTNWSCGSLPDSTTDVIINMASIRYPQVNSNVACRSLNVQPGAAVLVKAGFRIEVKGKD